MKWLRGLVIAVGFSVSLLGAFFYGMRHSAPVDVNNSEVVTVGGLKAILDQKNINEDVFGLKKKDPATKIFFSKKLGVGFTYLKRPCDEGVKIVNGKASDGWCMFWNDAYVAEKDNEIYLSDKTPVDVSGSGYIKVFPKDPSQTLEEAVTEKLLQKDREKFLKDKSNDCYVDVKAQNGTYDVATIKTTLKDPDNITDISTSRCDYPFWYSEFLMNEEVPSKFLEIRHGQESDLPDGTTPNPFRLSGNDWRDSIRILK